MVTYAKIGSWCTLMAKLRINPKAVCRQLLVTLSKNHKDLSRNEEVAVIHALQNCGVPNATDRLLASLSRNTIESLLENMQ